MTKLEQRTAVLLDVIQDWLTLIAETDSAPGNTAEVLRVLYLKQMELEARGVDSVNLELEPVNRYANLELDVINWAHARSLVVSGNASSQFLKTVAEIGELADGLARNDMDEIKDGIGDVLVTLIILCEIKRISMLDCLQAAYNEISNRKGKTVDGVFIKDV